jgi:hypothetical protein
MLNASWATLLRQIPADQHDQLMLRTANGTEISVQNLLRIDFEFVVVKGRLSGSQDNGRVFILPYGNIDYFGINRFVKDEEYTALFATVVIPDPEAKAAPPAPAAAATPPAPAPTGAMGKPTVADASLQVIRPSRPSSSSVKSSVLERFRSRNNPSAASFADE